MRPLRSLPTAFLATLLAAPALAQSVSSFNFAQADFYAQDGTLLLQDSSWGYFEMSVVPHPTDTWFFNLASSSGAWLVQNLPIFPESALAAGRRGVDFDIVELGLAEGTPLSSIDYVWSIAPAPQAAAPAGASTFALVSSIERRPSDDRLAGGLGTAGRPEGKKGFAGPTHVILHDNVREVQEGRSRCLAGALSRSFKWLDSRYFLAHNPNAQDVYAALVGLNVGSSGPGATTYEQDLAAAQTHWRAVDPTTELKVNDPGGDVDLTTVPAVAGLAEIAAVDIVDWIRAEFPTKAMELHYRHAGGPHIITIVGTYQDGPVIYLMYRDDEAQGPGVNGTNNIGDKAVKDAQLKLVGATWHFRRQGNESPVRVALSHSGTDPLRVFCGGDGLDGNVLPCPCGNTGAPGHGCSNSVTPAGGLLASTGSPSADNVVLQASSMPMSTSCIFLQGDGDDDVFFGDGVRCAGGSLLRLRTRFAVGGAAAFPDSTDTITLSIRGGVIPGSGMVRYYQTYYRNAAAFCTPATFNITNGLRATW